MTVETRARWHTHGWNREISWKLIVGVLPRVPAALRPPLHLALTTVCFVAMGRERRAARRNLAQVTGARGAANLALAWRLFHNFSRFMTAYVDLPPWAGATQGLEDRIDGGEWGIEAVRRLLSRGRGLIVLGMHLGQWDLALIALARAGYRVTVVMRREEEEASRIADECRRAAGIRIVHAGESPWSFVELRAALGRNEIVAMQGDRDMGGRTMTVPLFGRPVRIPAGPWELASLSGAPILPGALLLRGGGHYEMAWGELIEARGWSGANAGDRADTPAEGAGDPTPLARAMESLIRRFPDQWFNFYDVWGREEVGRA